MATRFLPRLSWIAMEARTGRQPNAVLVNSFDGALVQNDQGQVLWQFIREQSLVYAEEDGEIPHSPGVTRVCVRGSLCLPSPIQYGFRQSLRRWRSVLGTTKGRLNIRHPPLSISPRTSQKLASIVHAPCKPNEPPDVPEPHIKAESAVGSLTRLPCRAETPTEKTVRKESCLLYQQQDLLLGRRAGTQARPFPRRPSLMG